MPLNHSASFEKARRIANRCRDAKGWKGGSLFARSDKANTGSLYIYSIIGSSWFEEGVTAQSVRDALDALKGVKTLNVFINSEGGDVFEAKAIYTQLKRFSAEKVVYIDGLAASAATFVAMAGDRIVMSPAASFMIHEAWTMAMGNAGDLRDTADLLDMLNSDIADIYAKRSGRDVAELRALMAEETWFTAAQTVEAKLADEVATYEDPSEDTSSNSASLSKVAVAATTTQQRISAMTAELLQFRVRRASLSIDNANRASPAKRPEPSRR